MLGDREIALKKLGTKGQDTSVPASEAGKRLVLYVEDEEENREVTALRLRDRFELLWATNDREACALILRYHSRLYAILMDIQLKGSQLDGIQLVRLLRGEPLSHLPSYAQGLPTLDVPIIFVTAYGARYTEEQLLAFGGTHVVTKPVDFVNLTLALANAHARSALEKLDAPRPERSSLRDLTTGLYTEKYVSTAIAAELLAGSKRPLSLMIMDIDAMDKFNERFGQTHRDRILKQIANILHDRGEHLKIRVRGRTSDIACRYGAGFALILPGVDQAGAKARAESLRATVEEYPFAFRETQPGGAMTISIGLATLPQNASTKEELIDAAAKALAQAKQVGGNRIVLAI